MTEKQILSEQLTASFDENGWFVALKNALKDVNAERAGWRVAGLDNSIRGILSHLNFYNERYLRRFRGEIVLRVDIDNSETFAGGASEDAWQAEVERFDSIMNGWRQALESASESRLNEPYSEEHQSPWASVISHINLHNAHHGGQIVLIRKLQGSWDTRQGVS